MRSASSILWRNFSTCVLLFLMLRCDGGRLMKNEVPATEIDEYGCECVWTNWMNNDDYEIYVGDDTTYTNLRQLYNFCQEPKKIKCRDKHRWAVPYRLLHVKNTVCHVKTGLRCVSTPWREVRGTTRKPHYCTDFEISVQCCSCPTTTPWPLSDTTGAMTTINEVTGTQIPRSNELVPGELLAVEADWTMPSSNRTVQENEVTSAEDIPLVVILISVIGCIVIVVFMIIIWLILTKTDFYHKKKSPHQNFYQEAPLDDFSPASTRDTHASSSRLKVAFASTKGSTSDYITSSSEDEGYRSRPNYNKKRKTKSQRNRKLNNSNHGYGSDSFEFQTLDSRTPTEENSDDGRFRKWFPDEYERSLQQKGRHPIPKTRLVFNTPFTANNKKSIPYMDTES